VVIGTGAGGGPVAANLAGGPPVLVLEAGGDGNNRIVVQIRSARRQRPHRPNSGGRMGQQPRESDDRDQQHFYVPGKGLYYPRGTSIGGSTPSTR
jgi:choline dehydrogenase-like flavoprotein